MIHVRGAGRSDVGKVRSRNEDAAFVGANVYAVADGVGGHKAGHIASSMLISVLNELDAAVVDTVDKAAVALRAAFLDANQQIIQRGVEDPTVRGMATTVTAVMIVDGVLVSMQVGDTRGYLKRRGEPLRHFTPEHSYVRSLQDAGVLTAEQAKVHPHRSLILRGIGLEPGVEPEEGERITVQPGDEIVLVSDGVHGVIDDETLDTLIHERPLVSAVDDVIDAVRRRGAPDNVTIVVLQVYEDDENEAE